MTDTNFFKHQDALQELSCTSSLNSKLYHIHRSLKAQHDFIDRMSVALYDHGTDTLKTYTHSTYGHDPLTKYEAKLCQAPSLQEIIQRRTPRVIQNLNVFSNSQKKHTTQLKAHGFQSSYTLPMYQNDLFIGFLFFNSYSPEPFNTASLQQLDIYAHLIISIVTNELTNIRTLIHSVKAARGLTYHRDFETGAHTERTAHYARLIARGLSEQYLLNDETIEHIFLFSPLHDIGKIAIPDTILHKPGKLNADEFEVMKTHTIKGRQIINDMLNEFGLETIQHISILGNIAEYHHEAMDGSGYPKGLVGSEIPIEARISSVADVFDALTSHRPYKSAWSNDKSIDMLKTLAGEKLDPDCVNALIGNKAALIDVQQLFQD